MSYKDIPSLSMAGFKGLVCEQVQKAQTELEDLLLLHPSEGRCDLDIGFRMH